MCQALFWVPEIRLYRLKTGKYRLGGVLKIKSWLLVFAYLVTFFLPPTLKASIFLLFLWFIEEPLCFQKTTVCPPMCCIIPSHVHSQRGTTATEYNGLFSRWVWNQLIQPNESCRKLAAPKESIGIIYKTTLSPNKVWEFYFRILHILI